MSIYSIANWSSASTYSTNDIVRYPSDSNFYYYSLTNGNSNNVPSASSTVWGGIGSSNGVTRPKFIWKPNYGAVVTHEPNTTVIQFGGGYSQRLDLDINSDLLKIQVSFELRTDKETEAIVHFFFARRGKEAFLYTPNKPHDLEKLFKCAGWTERFIFQNNHTVTALFEEVPA